MASTGEEPLAPSVEANAPPLPSNEAKMIVAMGRDHCQQLKDMVSKEDPSTMVVVMSSSRQTSTPPEPRSPSPLMDTGLLAVACSGSWKKLQAFLNGDSLPTSAHEIMRCCCCSWTKRPAKPRPASSNGTVRCCCFLWKTRKSFPPEEPHPSSSDGAIGSSAIQPPSSDLEAHPRVTVLDGVTFEGDTFLHVMATNSVGDDLIEDEPCRIRSKAVELLFARNKKEDTPLHCAARADKSQMVSFLLDLATGNDPDTVKALLETENSSGWTVLHEAVRVGNNEMVKSLMKNDADLARFPKDGTSPMYLAILLDRKIIAETLHKESDGVLSYSGPNGQNALHAAVLRSKGLTNMLLDWNKDTTIQRGENWKDLTIQRDEKGNTPLHYAASILGQKDRRAIRLRLLQANQDALYQPDKDGSFPIHVAASVNASLAVGDFIKKSPRCAGLRDARGRTFLHVAADKKHSPTVSYACRYQNRLSWIMNMQDNDGNTALHLVVQARSLTMFCAILANMHVNINLTNEKDETPRDIARYNLPNNGFYSNQNSESKIHGALVICGAKKGISRQDYFGENDIVQVRQDEIRQLEIIKEATQNLIIGTVLIATVTFGATFAMPGGYRADDHTNGGTPTLAGRYAFDTFTLANALAFTTSTMATISLMFSGSPLLRLRSRSIHLGVAYYLMMISVKCLVAAFAIGTYMMLAPVAHKTAVAVCALSSLVLLYENLELIIKNIVCITPFRRRKGICFSFLMLVYFIVANIVVEYWPIIVIFCSTLRSYHTGKTDSAIQPLTASP